MRRAGERGTLPWMDIDLAGLVGPGLCLSGRYRMVEPIGAGGMAVVWRAADSVLARTVAVKVLAPDVRDPGSLARLRHEARAAASLSHPNIAQVYDYGESEVGGTTVPYVVLELVTGGTLLDRLRTGELPPRQALRICAETAAALAAAHATGLVHRDIKPANIMLAPTGVKVVDFGIAAAHGPAPQGDLMLGTPTYVAPERLIGTQVLPASDVYALGVLLYRLLAGHSPWPADPPTRVLANHLSSEPPPLVPLRPVPSHVLDLCARCLSKDPAARPTAREAARLLAHAAGFTAVEDAAPAPHPAGGAPPEPSIIIRPPARRRAAALLRPAATVAVLAAVGAAAWLSTRPGDSAPRPDRPAEAAPSASAVPSGALSPTATTAPPGTPAGPRPGPRSGIPGVPGMPGSTSLAPTTTPLAPAPPTQPASSPTSSPAAAPTTTTPVGPSERTLTSAGGTVTANCPSSGTARILSWTAAAGYRVKTVDTADGPSPSVVFTHGQQTVTMTVTCHDGVPRSEVA
jgi:serine/threonine protein kinase